MRKNEFKIVVDSASDILNLKGVDFASAPLKIITDERGYVDNAELDVDEMISELRSYKGRSSTACPSPADFIDAFGDAEKIFCVTVTSKLSGSYSSARIAKCDYEEEHPDRHVYIMDSLTAGPEIRLFVEKIRELILEDKSFEDICSELEKYRKTTALLFMLESLNNLANNGRVSNSAAKMASMLGIRIIGKAHEGELKLLLKCCGEKKALAALFEKLENMGYKGGKLRIAYCNNESAARKIAIRIRRKYDESDIKIYHTRGLCSFYAEKGGLLMAFEK